MIDRTRWTERTFDFNFPVGYFPFIVERLRGTPTRLEERLGSMSPEQLTASVESGWTIQEHAGHLIQIELLHTGRLDDFRDGLKKLRPAEMSGQSTFDADYNNQPLGQVLATFRDDRSSFVRDLEEIDETIIARQAMHPRLEVPMRLIDMAFFAAEHDDYHLAVISDIERKFSRDR